jgi:hypothetical protein
MGGESPRGRQQAGPERDETKSVLNLGTWGRRVHLFIIAWSTRRYALCSTAEYPVALACIRPFKLVASRPSDVSSVFLPII